MHSVGARLLARGDNPSLSNGEDSPFAYTAGPYVPTECWSNSDFATGACCAHFNATRVAVKGSSIKACSFHDIGAWDDCISSKISSSNVQCQSSGARRRMRGAGGVTVILGLVVGQLLAAFVLS
ncbi:hypothetical protein DFH09DRAFT_1077948 [Mycena vulgaris]|nr:hypothetical protein DFH09DRAFT_1077948 [Mycena vulgaris]